MAVYFQQFQITKNKYVKPVYTLTDIKVYNPQISWDTVEFSALADISDCIDILNKMKNYKANSPFTVGNLTFVPENVSVSLQMNSLFGTISGMGYPITNKIETTSLSTSDSSSVVTLKATVGAEQVFLANYSATLTIATTKHITNIGYVVVVYSALPIEFEASIYSPKGDSFAGSLKGSNFSLVSIKVGETNWENIIKENGIITSESTSNIVGGTYKTIRGFYATEVK